MNRRLYDRGLFWFTLFFCDVTLIVLESLYSKQTVLCLKVLWTFGRSLDFARKTDYLAQNSYPAHTPVRSKPFHHYKTREMHKGCFFCLFVCLFVCLFLLLLLLLFCFLFLFMFFLLFFFLFFSLVFLSNRILNNNNSNGSALCFTPFQYKSKTYSCKPEKEIRGLSLG